MIRRALVLAGLTVGGFGVASIASSAPPPGFCDRKPHHPHCVATTAPPPTTTVAPPPTITAPPPTTTTPPAPSGTANLWVVP